MGAEAVEALAARLGARLRRERSTHARVALVRRDEEVLVLAVPETYMNESGVAVAALVRRHHLADLEHLVVVHDDLDLPTGALRVKRGGGTAGHNGLRSIEAHLRSLEFVRVRIGISKPPGRMPGAEYVLRRPGRAEAEALAVARELAADAVELIAAKGVEPAMNALNGR